MPHIPHRLVKRFKSENTCENDNTLKAYMNDKYNPSSIYIICKLLPCLPQVPSARQTAQFSSSSPINYNIQNHDLRDSSGYMPACECLPQKAPYELNRWPWCGWMSGKRNRIVLLLLCQADYSGVFRDAEFFLLPPPMLFMRANLIAAFEKYLWRKPF